MKVYESKATSSSSPTSSTAGIQGCADGSRDTGIPVETTPAGFKTAGRFSLVVIVVVAEVVVAVVVVIVVVVVVAVVM